MKPCNQANISGGLWYFTYPSWSYLDGMYSLIPFSWLYATHFNPGSSDAAIDESIYQLDLLWQHCHQNSTGLLVHGYDGSQAAVWANSLTGASPIVWVRSLSWYFMTLVDMLELLSLQSGAAEERYRRYLSERLTALTKAVLAAADRDSGCWWQVMTAPRKEGNYIESSGSAIFTYALLKGARLELFDVEDGAVETIVDAASQCYRHLVSEFVVEEGDGTLGYNGTVSVCSLNSSATYEVNPSISGNKEEANSEAISIMSISRCCITASMGLLHLYWRVWNMRRWTNSNCPVDIETCLLQLDMADPGQLNSC